ncbi:STM4015 family protein [Streptomyces sp. NPDC055078]
MTISSHLQELHGLPVFDFPQTLQSGDKTGLPPESTVAWRIAVDPYGDGDTDEEWEQAFARFLGTVDTTEVRALVVGPWAETEEDSPDSVVAELAGARAKLPALRAVFLGDITCEESEISWITQGLVTPVLDAYPELLELGVRGGQSLTFPAVRHANLRSLVIETGGLDAEVVRGVAASDLPALEHLDLWLGTSWYGANADVADLEPILTGTRLPSLRYLALRNSDMQDQVAAAVAGAPVVARLDTLDLSMGTLGDEGAEALLNGQPLTHLRKLDLHHHFIGEPMRKRLIEAFQGSGVELVLDDQHGRGSSSAEQEHRYTAVAE